MLQLNLDELLVTNVVLVSVVNCKKVRWGKPPLRNINRLYGDWYKLENNWNLNISSNFANLLNLLKWKFVGRWFCVRLWNLCMRVRAGHTVPHSKYLPCIEKKVEFTLIYSIVNPAWKTLHREKIGPRYITGLS